MEGTIRLSRPHYATGTLIYPPRKAEGQTKSRRNFNSEHKGSRNTVKHFARSANAFVNPSPCVYIHTNIYVYTCTFMQVVSRTHMCTYSGDSILSFGQVHMTNSLKNHLSYFIAFFG